ncbi:hypothetical protein HPB50_022158 [Hyalomma asiaticum]|uniref:Uncharacterized protein n=1 Tax=Hyalomma asiaticum TaxID=266040 RepID=A0ACB7RVX1_HYAAI|nr:hypothetical protein HPB50_022158 [Hyalomma asiaticum]
MDTSSSRKRPRPTESTSDDEGSSRKVPAVTPAPESGTPPPVEASAVLHDADDGFQTVQSKSQKRRQRAAAAAGTTARCVPPSGSTHSGSSTPAAAPPAVVTTTPTSVSTRASPHQCGITVLFRPAIPGATFPRTSRLSLAQALSALPGVQEVRVNTKKNVVAADAITPNWRDRLLATTELAGIPVNARMPADRTQSSGIVQGIIGNYTEEELLAGVQSDVPVLAAKRQGTALILRFAASTPPAQVRLFRMVHAVRACRPRPLQCLRCGSYGHTTATCNRTQRCLRCGGGPHGDSTCTSKAKCLHCGRAHTADSPDCQLWQRERRLATIKATAPSFLTHREAVAALQQPAASSPPAPTSQQTGTSYAQAAKKPRGARKPPGHPGNQRACPKQHHGQEMADMRLLLRAMLEAFPQAVSIYTSTNDTDLLCVTWNHTYLDLGLKKATFVWDLKGHRGSVKRNVTFDVEEGEAPDLLTYYIDNDRTQPLTGRCIYSDYDTCAVINLSFLGHDQCMLWVKPSVVHRVPRRCRNTYKQKCRVPARYPTYDSRLC